MEQELVSCKLVSKFHNELRDYFKSIYGLPSIIAFTNTLIYKSIVTHNDWIKSMLFWVSGSLL